MSLNSSANPGLAPFDISDYRGVAGLNFYDSDPALRDLAEENAAGDAPYAADLEHHLSGYGALCGGILNDLAEAAHKEGKYGYVEQFDRAGNRIDRVVYCTEQLELRRISYEYGICNLDFHPDWKHRFSMFHRMALAYLANLNGEAGFTCPLAMTDGMIRALKALGAEEQQQRYLQLVAARGSASHFMCGQYVTERVGGSNVAQNRTVAERRADGSWTLNGEKWFCSNPGDLWVTTARVNGGSTIGLFLVPRLKRNGELNGARILRKKDIIGSRGKITVEVVYEDCEAEELGRPAHGLANLIKYVIQTSRLHVAVSGAGISRRAFLEARAYSRAREAYGRKIKDFPSSQRTLAEMQCLHQAQTLLCFRNLNLAERGAASALALSPLLKYTGSALSTWLTHQAILLHGGNGILGDFSILPRLHNDSIINETWEGTHQIIAEHTHKAFQRSRVQAALAAELELMLTAAPASLDSAAQQARADFQRAQAMCKDSAWLASNGLVLCDTLYQSLALAELIRQAGRKGGVYIELALGFAEIVRRGRMGACERGGLFADAERMQAIIDW
ncbi:MAG: acyl-CoA dehydrogenase family protein [Leptospirales bacterium]|nr:acyl-CoA dehydrogenase family protein [Leptospirales bacterium]